MRIQIVLSVLAAAGLSACALVKPINPNPVFPMSDEHIVISKADHRLKADSVNCAVSAENWEPLVQPSAYSQFVISSYCAFKATDTEKQTRIVDFVEKGIALSKHACEDFFNKLEDRRTQTNVTQSGINIAGSAITAALAEAGGHQRAIFNLATGLTATNAGMETYQAAFLLTPALKELRDLIQNGRQSRADAMKTKTTSNGGYSSFTEAKEDILAFDELCTHKVIADVVSKSLANNKFDFPDSTIPYESQKSAKTEKDKLCTIVKGSTGICTPDEYERLIAFASFDLIDRKILAAIPAPVPADLTPISAFITKLDLAENKDTGQANIAAIRRVAVNLRLESDPNVRLIQNSYLHLIETKPLKDKIADLTKAKSDNTTSAKANIENAAKFSSTVKDLDVLLKDSEARQTKRVPMDVKAAKLPERAIPFSYNVVPKN
jgi:hypothetical protein